MRDYELVFIAHPEVEEEGLADIREQIRGLIISKGGQVTTVDLWGRRRLAYPIAKQLEGHYVVMQLELDPVHLPELEWMMRLDTRIMRRLLIRSDG